MTASRRLSVLVLCSVYLFLSQLGFAAKPSGGGAAGTYRIVPLASSPGLVQSINASGQMVGFFRDPPLAAHWELDAQGNVATITLDREILVGDEIVAYDSVAGDVNDQGIIAGALGNYETGTDWRPVVWFDEFAPARELPIPAGIVLDGGEAFAVSNYLAAHTGLQAVVVGRFIEAVGTSFHTHVAAWAIRTDGSIADAVVLDVGVTGKFESAAVDINSGLTVVGTLDQQAMRWQLAWDGQTLSVTTSQSLFPGVQFSSTSAINDSGDICGTRSGTAYLLENVGGVLTERSLGKLVDNRRDGTDNVRAAALDNSSTPRVVGSVNVYTKSSGIISRLYDPELWQGSSVLDLTKATSSTTLLPNYLNGINGAGRIVGDGWTGQIHVPVVLIPQ